MEEADPEGNYGKLKQDWHCETILTDFYDADNPDDFPRSVEVWSSIISGKNMAGITKGFRYEYTVKGISIRIPDRLGTWVEKNIHYGDRESLLSDLLFRLNFIRDSGIFHEVLWDFKLRKEETCFSEADEYHAENLIAYNQKYRLGARCRRLMGDYLRVANEYNKLRRSVATAIYEYGKGGNSTLDYQEVIATIDKTPSERLKHYELKRLRRKRENLRRKLERQVLYIFEESKNRFLEALASSCAPENISRIDFAYFNHIDTLLHLFNERSVLRYVYRARARVAAKRKKGYGGQKFPLQHNQAKVTKKQSLMLVCEECGFKKQRKGIRLSKMEVGG